MVNKNILFTGKSPGLSGEVEDKLLIDIPQLSHLTSLSIRHLRRLDASRDIPGRVMCGRRVLFQTEIILAWVKAGLPGHDQWTGLLSQNGKF